MNKEVEEKISSIFDLMKKGNNSPYYRLEDKFGVFFPLYINKIIQKCKSKKFNIVLDDNFDIEKNVFAEFPLSYIDASDEKSYYGNADFAVFYKNNNKLKAFLIEIKTNEKTNTRKEHIENQNNLYLHYRENGTKYAIEQILNRKNNQKQNAKKDKYQYLEACIRDVCKSYNFGEELDWNYVDESPMEIIYICGKNFYNKQIERGISFPDEFNIIFYDEIYDKIFKNCDKLDIIDSKMKELLENIIEFNSEENL